MNYLCISFQIPSWVVGLSRKKLPFQSVLTFLTKLHANLLSNRLVNQTQIKKKAGKGEEIKKEREMEREKVKRLREILFKALREKERLQGNITYSRHSQ